MALVGKLSKKSIVAISIIALGVLLFILMLLFKPNATSSDVREKQWPIHAMTLPSSSDHISQIHLYGKVEHSRLTQLSAAIAAPVQQVLVKEGQTVLQGQLLVQLDSHELELTMHMHQADLDHIQSEIDSEKVNLLRLEQNIQHQKALFDLAKESQDRYDNLSQQTYVSKEDLNSKQREYKLRSMQYENSLHEVEIDKHQLVQLQARQKKLEYQIKLDQLNIGYCHIKAPEAGEVTQLPVAVGERVQVGNLLVEVMPSQQKEVRALVPLPRVMEIDLQLADNILPKSIATVSGHPVTLQLMRLTQHVLPGQAGREAIFEAQQGGDFLVLGRYLSLYLSLNAIPNSYIVPESALYHDKQVYSVVDNRLQAIPVTVVGWHYEGLRRDYIVKSEDLHQGMLLLSNQLPNAINGMLVKVQSAG